MHSDLCPSESAVVAVVDDDPSVASALGQWLGMLGVPAAVFHEGISLLSAIKFRPDGQGLDIASGQVQGAFLGVVIDLNLPHINGFEVARRLLRLAPELRIVVITAANIERMELFGGVPDGVICLDKPFTLEQIEAALFGPAHT